MQERTPRNERHEMNDNPAPAPSPASHCSRGGSRVLMATSRDGEGRGGHTNERHGGYTNERHGGCTNERHVTNTNPAPTPSTCHHACEPLLTGWVTGATNATRAERTKPNEMNETTHPPPQHLPPCLRATARRVGNRCYGYDEGRTDENEHNEGRTNGNGMEPHTPGSQPPSHIMRGRIFFR
jgi:hypothetical protein